LPFKILNMNFDPFKDILSSILIRKIINKLLLLKKPIEIEVKEISAIGPDYIKYSKKTIKEIPRKIDINLLKGYALYLSKNQEELKKILGEDYGKD